MALLLKKCLNWFCTHSTSERKIAETKNKYYKKGKNSRYKNDYSFKTVEQYKQKEYEYYEQKDFLLTSLLKPSCIHKKVSIREVKRRIYSYEDEYWEYEDSPK